MVFRRCKRALCGVTSGRRRFRLVAWVQGLELRTELFRGWGGLGLHRRQAQAGVEALGLTVSFD